MASDTSADESAFTDCATQSSQHLSSDPERRATVPEIFRRVEGRKPKRPAPDRSSRSPRDSTQPAAKRPPPAGPGEPAEPPAMGLSAGALAAIRRLLDEGIAAFINAFEVKFEEKMERRLNIIESEAMDKDLEIKRLNEQLENQIKTNEQLEMQVESIDLNRRLSSLLLTCDDFDRKSANENLEARVVKTLNDRISYLNLTTDDIQVTHRLQRDNKVICKFIKRSVRDKIYDARFELQTRELRADRTGLGGRGGSASYSGRQLPPLYINESLTNYNQHLYNQLLQVRKASGGSRIASVFSRRGLVFCRTSKNGPNIRVPNKSTLQRIIGDSGAGASRLTQSGSPPASAPSPGASPSRCGLC